MIQSAHLSTGALGLFIFNVIMDMFGLNLPSHMFLPCCTFLLLLFSLAFFRIGYMHFGKTLIIILYIGTIK